jgi:hypothetical protein
MLPSWGWSQEIFIVETGRASWWRKKPSQARRGFAILWPINATPDDFHQTNLADSCRALEASADFARGGGPPAPDHDADHIRRQARVEAEQRRLIEWARANGKIAPGGRLPPAFARGGEHQVYFHKRTRRYFKATLPERHFGYGIALGSIVHGATPSEYVDRLALQNRIFDDDIRLERIIANRGFPIVVTSQPAIKGSAPSQVALDELMLAKGYERLAEGAYYDPPAGLLVFDLFPRNAIQADDGQIYPIDPVIQRITPDFGDFLRQQPFTINLLR